jgi:hypothetical protein
MSRSIRKTPIFGNAKAASEKSDKQAAHQTQRAHFRTAVQSASNVEDLVFDESNKAHSNIYSHAKDGRHHVTGLNVKQVGRALQVHSAPRWMGDIRGVHKAMGK